MIHALAHHPVVHALVAIGSSSSDSRARCHRIFIQRFTRRTHLWQRVGKQPQKRLADKPRKKLLARMWMQLWKDRCVFGQTRVGLKQADLDALLEAFWGSRTDKPIDELAVLPEDPSVPVLNGNPVLVAKKARRELLAEYRHDRQIRQSMFICFELPRSFLTCSGPGLSF